MSRCEHNEKITKFCITPSCSHPNSGGCEYCFKKHHCHLGQLKFIKQAEVVDMVRYLTSFDSKKIKIRPLKQAIYNYFNIIKGQLSSYLDGISSDLLNKVSYPYVTKQGQMATFKKIKHKDYNKLSTSEMMKIVKFKEQTQPQLLQKQQIHEYIKQCDYVHRKINDFNQLFQKIESQAKDLVMNNNSLNVGIFHQKINQIYDVIKNSASSQSNKDNNSLQHASPTQQKNNNLSFLQEMKKQSKDSSKKVEQKDSFLIKQQERQAGISLIQPTTTPNKLQAMKQLSNSVKVDNINELSSGRKRTVSIDSKCGQLFGGGKIKQQILSKKKKEKSNVNQVKSSYEEKEKEIQERKRRLDQLMSSSFSGSRITEFKDNDSQRHTRSTSSNNKMNKMQQSGTRPIKNSQSSDSDNGSRLFEMFAKQGINIPELIIQHTLLPAAHEEKTLYEQNEKLQKRTIKVPVCVIPQNIEAQDCLSPILRLKHSYRARTPSGTGFQLQRVSSKKQSDYEHNSGAEVDSSQQRQSNRKSHTQEELEDVNGSSKQSFTSSNHNDDDDNVNIDEAQASSLYLLAESFKLSASKAIPLLVAALKYAPHNFSAAEYLTFLYLQENKPKLCLDVCNASIKLISGEANPIQISFHLYNNKAAALNQLGRFSESISILQQCLLVKKKDIFYKNLGDAYFQLGIIEKALINYENSIILNQDNHEALYNMAVCLYGQKNYDACKLKIQRALLADPKNQTYRELLKEVESNIKKDLLKK